jgi:Zn-dependent protease with chaperone function
MDFFEAQDQARKGTTKLVVLFVFAMLGTVIALNAIALGAAHFVEQNQASAELGAPPPDPSFDFFRPGLQAIVSLATIAVIGGASLFKSAQLHGDGGKVARLLGGRLLEPTTTDADERKLLNVIEEMSLASGVPVPDTYVMDREMGINAFAAGSDVDNAAIGVTRGLMETMSRDELQGVIAHEYSHILNGDMRLNVRLIGVIFGILVIGLLGYAIFRYAPYLMMSRGSGNNKNNGAAVGIALFVVGGLVWLVGSIGVLFGRLIQASISRQREFLADASAVQFTRNPHGIRDALRKIGGNSEGAIVHNPHAGECSHLFFGNAFNSFFSTHPPLPQRIKAIDPAWDGSMLAPVAPEERRPERKQRKPKRQSAAGPLGPLGQVLDPHLEPHRRAHTPGMSPASMFLGAAAAEGMSRQSARDVAGRVGQLQAEDVAFGSELAGQLPDEIRRAARDPVAAKGLVACLFLSRDTTVRAMQEDLLSQRDSQAASAAGELADGVAKLGPGARLPILELAAPVLRQLGKGGPHFLESLRGLIEADRTVEPFEYALYKLATRFVHRPPVRERYGNAGALEREARVILSGIAAAGSGEAASEAFQRGADTLGRTDLEFEAGFTLTALDAALEKYAQAHPPLKRSLIAAAAATVSADGMITVEEGELLRAIGAVLHCPIPPLVGPAGPASDVPAV